MGRKISLSDIETQFTRSLSSPQPESQFWELCIFQPFILLQVLISCFQKLHILTFWNNCPLKIADQSQNIPLCWDVKIESKSETTSLFLRKNIQWQPSLVRLTTTNEFGDPGEVCAERRYSTIFEPKFKVQLPRMRPKCNTRRDPWRNISGAGACAAHTWHPSSNFLFQSDHASWGWLARWRCFGWRK